MMYEKAIFTIITVFLFSLFMILTSGQMSWGQNLLDDYDGTGDLTYTTEGDGTDCWEITGGEYKAKTNGVSTPEHSYASYDLSNSITGWELDKTKGNVWLGWMEITRDSISGWGGSNYSCGMILAANSSDINDSNTSGYAVVFRNDPDELVIIKFSQGITSGSTNLPENSTQLVSSGYTYGGANTGVNFFVELLSDGKWKIYYKSGTQLSSVDAVDKSNYNEGNATSASADETYTGTDYKYAGWVWSHSTSGSAFAYFDNLGADMVNVSDATDYFRSKATGDWNASSSWESSPNGTDWIDATLTPTDQANTITIRNAHTITVTSAETASTLTVDSGGSLTLSGSNSLTVSNASDINGTLNIGTGTYDANGNFDADTGTITFSDIGYLKLGGIAVNSLGTLTATAGTVIYYRNGDQTILADSYFNLTVATGGKKTLGGDIDVDGDFLLSAGSFDMNDHNMNVAGDFTISSGATFTAGSGTLTFDGTTNFTDNTETQDLGNVKVD